MTAPLYEFTLPSRDGGSLRLADYAGQVLLLVNTASECGFTPQYAGLEQLWRDYRERGFAVLGFPCNQFGHQEPGDAAAIAEFCATRYGVSFPMSAKIEVNGAHADPLYRHLTRAAPGLLGSAAIKWNFTKFLVDRNGHVVRRYAPSTAPADLAADIERLLAD
jgi:glutathione peroxidase